MFYGLFDKVEVNCSVVTRSVGTDVQYACRWKRVNVLNAAGEVAFAGDGEHHFGMKFFGDFAGKRAAGSDTEMKAEPFGHGNERADGTAVAAFAIVYIVRAYDLKIVSMGPINGIVTDLTYCKDDLSLYLLLDDNTINLARFNI